MRASAFLVHALTASGAALALFALLAAVRGDWTSMFLWLGAALAIDAIDGPLARAANVAEAAPRWSGEMLDLVVDFTTYVFVPAYAVAAAGLVPDTLAVPAAALIVITGALYFADREMKTAENFFRGFPAVWNVVVFYLLLLKPATAVAAAIIAVFAAATFVPVRFVHPFRVRRFRSVTVALLVLWAAFAAAALKQGLEPQPWLAAVLCLIAIYFCIVGLFPARTHPT
jgi:phosphatidylcholine synthase